MFRESGVSKRFRLAGVSDSGIPDPAQTSMPRTALSDILPTARQVQARQDLLTSTLEPAESKTDTVLSPSTGSNEPTRTSPSLQTANTPIPLAATVGLVMPNPWSELYAGRQPKFTTETRCELQLWLCGCCTEASTYLGRVAQTRSTSACLPKLDGNVNKM